MFRHNPFKVKVFPGGCDGREVTLMSQQLIQLNVVQKLDNEFYPSEQNADGFGIYILMSCYGRLE